MIPADKTTKEAQSGNSSAFESGAGAYSPVQLAINNSPVMQKEQARLQAMFPLQLKKTEEERGEKHKRVAKSKEAIGLLKGSLKANLVAHVFKAKKANGGEPDHDDPSGLHAYTGGSLPAGISGEVIAGSAGQVHRLRWNWNDSETTKESTMFPVWMPADHAKSLIALRYLNNEEVVVSPPDPSLGDRGISTEDVKTYIQHGQDINIGKSGDTVYPVM